MAGRFRPAANLDEILAKVVDELPEVDDALDAAANRIARGAVANSAMAQKYPGRYGPVEVSDLGGRRRRVAAKGPLAHLDEWGSANNPPRASMRRAAEAEGRFTPEGRP